MEYPSGASVRKQLMLSDVQDRLVVTTDMVAIMPCADPQRHIPIRVVESWCHAPDSKSVDFDSEEEKIARVLEVSKLIQLINTPFLIEVQRLGSNDEEVHMANQFSEPENGEPSSDPEEPKKAT